MYMHYKIVIILLNNQLFILKTNFMSIFCAVYRTTIKVSLYYLNFIEFVRLCHSQQCHYTRGKVVPVCVRNSV